MKKLISAAWTGHSVNWDQLSHALLQYRNTPCRKDGLSSAQKLFGHPAQDTLPTHRRSFAPEWQRSSQEADAALYTHQKHPRPHTHPLSDLQVGNHVVVQNPISKIWDIYGTITAVGPYSRYFIKTQSGRILAGTSDLFEKEVHCQLLAPHLACHQTPLNPTVLPALPTDPLVIRGSNMALQLLC